MVCHSIFSHCSHRARVVFVPDAPERIPPISQIDFSVPQTLHLTSHFLDSASIDVSVAAGMMALNIFCISPIRCN